MQKIYDVHELWTLFVRNMKWFAMSLFLWLCIGVAYVYFVKPTYKVSGKMLIVEKKKDATSAAISASALLQNQLPFGLGNSIGGSIGVENEKEILKSKLVAREVVKDLGLYMEYRVCGLLKSRLVYHTQPVNVSMNEQDVDALDKEYPTTYHQLNLTITKDSEGYQVEGVLKENKNEYDLPEQSFKTLPAKIKTQIGDLTLTENKELTAKQQTLYKDGYRLKVEIVSPTIAAISFAKKMQIASATKKATSVVVIDLLDEDIKRGIDYINSLAVHYNNRHNEDRRQEAAKNDEFVSKRLAKIDADLSLTDADFEKFKRQFQVTDPKVDAEEVMTKKGVYEGQIVNINTQIQLHDYLSEYINDPGNKYELIPANVAVSASDVTSATTNQRNTYVSERNITSLISQHNAYVSERNMTLKSASEQSPQVKRLTELIDDLHPVIKATMERERQSLVLKRNIIEKEYGKYMSRITNVPEQERALTEVTRQRTVKQSVYLSLLQKREENAMELANTNDKGKMIDATLYKDKVRPKTLIVLFLSLVLGILIPYLVIFLRRGLRGTVGCYDELLSETSLPVIGCISTDHYKDPEESFRTLRTHLLHQMGEDRKTILVTSYGSGEGKTYTAIHLAESLARVGKRVLLCEMNLRNPSIGKELGLTQRKGLCDILSVPLPTAAGDVSDVIIPVQTKGFDVLLAGTAQTTHPADLLAHKNLDSLIRHQREEYDVILLDTTAVDVYADALEVAGLADMTCFVCLRDKTPKTIFDKLMNQTELGVLPSPCIILNKI